MKPVDLPSIEEITKAGVSYDGTYLYGPYGRVYEHTGHTGLKITINKKHYRASRIAFLLAHRKPPTGRVKFLNSDPTDLRKENLSDGWKQPAITKLGESRRELPRYVSYSKGSKSRSKGSKSDSRGYNVALYFRGKTHYVGHSNDLNKAHWLAYTTEQAVYPELTTIEPPSYSPTKEDRASLLMKIKEIKGKMK